MDVTKPLSKPKAKAAASGAGELAEDEPRRFEQFVDDLGAAVEDPRHRVDVACLGGGVPRVKMIFEQRDDGSVSVFLGDVEQRSW